MRLVDTTDKPSVKESQPQNKEVVNEHGNKSKKFDDDTIELLLTTLVMNNGKTGFTSQFVNAEYGIEIHPDTLKRWKDVYYPSRYAEIQRNLADKLSTQLAGKITDVASQSITIQEELQDEMQDQLISNSFELKDLPSAIRNMAQASEISVRQKHLLEDKPTEILEVRNIEKTISELEESELVLDAEVVEDEDQPDIDTADSIALSI